MITMLDVSRRAGVSKATVSRVLNGTGQVKESTSNESFQTTENQTEGSQAESLMIAGLFVVCGRDYVELCRRLGKYDEANRAQTYIDNMVEAVKKHGWDGDWYLRAYDYFGHKVGSKENEEGQIFIESQGWCTMAGIGLDFLFDDEFHDI